MADDANALTPRQERLPTEADYEAICATVMQTARGRWFLAEYARRNRNADTRMVLDAVTRIEESMARAPQPASPADHAPAVAAAMTQARRRIADMLAGSGASAETMRHGVQALREITWTLREWGTDSGLCDRLDAHATAIAESCEAAARLASGEAILAVFDEWPQGEGEATMAAAAPPPPPAEPAPSNVSAAVAALKPATLGAALLDHGLVAAPRGGEALAPLRRMTQAEKVALFT